jgi:hypothetical protein
MTVQEFFKGLLMLLISAVVTAFGQQPVDYVLLAITAISVVLTYSGKNLLAVLHSDSPVGALSWVNMVSGVLIAVGTGVLQYIGMYYFEGVIIWSVLWKVVISVSLVYLGSTFFAPEHGTRSKVFVKGWRNLKAAA